MIKLISWLITYVSGASLYFLWLMVYSGFFDDSAFGKGLLIDLGLLLWGALVLVGPIVLWGLLTYKLFHRQ